MKELMMLSEEEIMLQPKWEECIITTCYAYREAEKFKVTFDVLIEIMREIINQLVEVFKSINNSISYAFQDLVDYCSEYFFNEDSMFKQPLIHNLDLNIPSFKVNTKGFPRPIVCRVRSRC